MTVVSLAEKRNHPQHQRHYRAQNQTRDDGEVELYVLAFVGDVAWQPSQAEKRNLGSGHHKQSDSDEQHARDNQKLAKLERNHRIIVLETEALSKRQRRFGGGSICVEGRLLVPRRGTR